MSTDLFSKQAGIYSKSRPQYPKEIYEFLATHAGSTDKAWDCATGNGQAAIGLAKYFRQVIATDLSAKQIENSIPAENIEYKVLKAEDRLDQADHSFDLITVAQALHWFDLDLFYKEVQRLLKPDGIFATWAYGFHAPIQTEIDKILPEFYFETLGPFWKENNKLIWDDYKNLEFPFRELTTPALELQVKWSLNDLLEYFKSWSATQLYQEKYQKDPTIELRQKILPHWGEPTEIKVLHWNLIFRAGKFLRRA